MTNQTKLYTRICPGCGKEISYTQKSHLNYANKIGSKCKSCKNLDIALKESTYSLDRLMDESPQSLYYTGLILADGSFFVGNPNSVSVIFQLGLHKDDEESLKTFSNYIGYKNELSSQENMKSVRFRSPHLKDYMNSYGFHWKKTYNPLDFWTAFGHLSRRGVLNILIGIIDGDGSIYEDPHQKHCYSIQISAHKNWKTFYTDLFNFLGWKVGIYHRRTEKDKNVITVNFGKREYIQELLNCINTDRLIVFERKWGKVQYPNP